MDCGLGRGAIPDPLLSYEHVEFHVPERTTRAFSYGVFVESVCDRKTLHILGR
jgi:hypothetical protein